MPWIIESDVDREDKEFGFNFVRYLILWDAIEPQKGRFDETYLDKVEERVNWYTSRGMHVMLDMHQDLYSIVFGGDGAPGMGFAEPMAMRTFRDPGRHSMVVKNIDPAVINSWINFWTYSGSNKDLQEHYILMWQKLPNDLRTTRM